MKFKVHAIVEVDASSHQAAITQARERLVGVSLKEELRKPRDGLVASLKGWRASAFSLMSQWLGRGGIVCALP